jgi:hypothetical protein
MESSAVRSKWKRLNSMQNNLWVNRSSASPISSTKCDCPSALKDDESLYT